MDELPPEVISAVAGQCDGPSLNCLARTNSEINDAMYGYPSQAIKYVERIGPLELTRSLLNLIDPADLITYSMECDLDLSKLGKFRGERTKLIGSRPIKLVFRLGSFELKVIKSEPGVKGNTATSVKKRVTLETNFAIEVPLFINNGDVVRVDTRTDKYVTRI